MEVIKRRPNLEETEKRTHEKNAKKLSFLGFPNCVK